MNKFKDEFTRGYLFAVATLLRQHDEPGYAKDALKEIGVRSDADLLRVCQEASLDEMEVRFLKAAMSKEWGA